MLRPITVTVLQCTVSSNSTCLWFPAITTLFILIDRSYCKESKPAIISAALSEWDWLVSPSLWYSKEQVYITLWALSLLQAVTAVCPAEALCSVLRLPHSYMQEWNHAMQHNGAPSCSPRRVHSHTACRLSCEQFVYMLSCLNVKYENKRFQRWKFFAIPLFSESVHLLLLLLPPPHPGFVSSPNLTCFPPSTLSSEAAAFRGVSLLAGVIPVNSCPQ